MNGMTVLTPRKRGGLARCIWGIRFVVGTQLCCEKTTGSRGELRILSKQDALRWVKLGWWINS